jgi:hypothetical protein
MIYLQNSVSPFYLQMKLKYYDLKWKSKTVNAKNVFALLSRIFALYRTKEAIAKSFLFNGFVGWCDIFDQCSAVLLLMMA